MKVLNIILLLLNGLLLLPIKATCQDLLADFKHISLNYYHSDKVLQYKTTIYYYSLEDPSAVFDSIQASYFIKNQNFKSSFGELDILLNDELQIIADKPNHQIKISQRPIATNSDLYSMHWIDTVLQMNKDAYHIIKSTDKWVSVRFNKYLSPAIDSIDIKYDRQSYFVNTVTFYYNNPGVLNTYDYGDFKPVMTIKYYDQRFIADDPDLFSEHEFIERRQDSFVGTGKYKDYRISASNINP